MKRRARLHRLDRNLRFLIVYRGTCAGIGKLGGARVDELWSARRAIHIYI